MMHGIDERKRWFALIVLCMGGAVVSAVSLSLIMNLFTSPADRARAGRTVTRAHQISGIGTSAIQAVGQQHTATGGETPRHEKAA
ncbi:hypothetical protein WN982_34000 [Paraburkholderia sp. IMGN_8]|uniref:hypothetical protein n=1 Tax=Paraburkholderia sp. IMGN_8 TaxID=3136564 RepID=UPI003101315A